MPQQGTDPRQEADSVANDQRQSPSGVEELGWFDAWRARARSHALIGPVYRIAVLALGTVILLAGVAMLALPGPGWAAIFVGLAVLASEFSAARRLKDATMARMRTARERAQDPAWRRRNRLRIVAATAVVVVAVGLTLWLWLDRYGWSVDPISNLP